MQCAIIFLMLLTLLGLIKVYVDWSGFERRTRRSEHVEMRDAKKVACRLGLFSAISGLASSMAAVIVRLSSSTGSMGGIDNISLLIYVVLCVIGWTFLVVMAFALKIIALMSVYAGGPKKSSKAKKPFWKGKR